MSPTKKKASKTTQRAKNREDGTAAPSRIQVAAQCGNSPKNQLVLDLTIAFAKADEARIRALVSDDICWHRVGAQDVDGAERFIRTVTRYGPASELTIDHVISHGKAAAVDGTVRFADSRLRAFCHVFEFSNAKGTSVSSITTYQSVVS